jgi:hypothetical protein
MWANQIDPWRGTSRRAIAIGTEPVAGCGGSERRRQYNDEAYDFAEVALPIPIITLTSH